MASVALDTDVLSFLFRDDPRGIPYHPHLVGALAIISFQTLAEVRRWPLERNWGQPRIRALDRHLAQFLIHFPDDDLCRRWAAVRAQCKRAGHAIDASDAWQAATAIQLNVPLLSHNRRHFIGVPGLTLVSYAEQDATAS
jgi:predicted nucleic acid-binding protein